MKLKLFFVLCVASFVEPSRILAVFSTPARSHFILANAYLRGLANKGHDVTCISKFQNTIPIQNGTYRTILLQTTEQDKKMMAQTINFKQPSQNSLENLFKWVSLTNNFTRNTLLDPNVQKLINSEEKFDVVVVGHFFNDALKALANHFNGHQVVFSTLGANSLLYPLVGNPENLATQPHVFLPYHSKMTFFQRVINILFNLVFDLIIKTYYNPQQALIKEEFFPDTPSYGDILKNASLILINGHESVNQPVALVPAMINIGGFHLEAPKNLPEDLQKFLDEAQDGVIYFSMGSNLKSSEMPEDKLNAFLNTFRKLKQKVLWKYEDDSLTGKPDNVKIGQWLPQQDILAHPNVKIFITHGGLLSTTETVYHGVPIIAIPIFGDQMMNAQRAVTGGYGLTLPFQDITEETLMAAINQMLTTSEYKLEVKRRSQLMNDRPIKPLDNAIYWTEYIIRNRGGKHLQVQALSMNFLQYYAIDVIVFLAVILWVLCFVVCKIVRSVVRWCKRSPQKLKSN